MKNIITALVVIVMSMVVNTANAEVVLTVQSQDNVRKYAEKSIPDVTTDEVDACYNAVKNGGEVEIKREKVKIKCSEEEMVVYRRLFF